MNLNEAKKSVDRTLASLFYERMKSVKAGSENASQTYTQAVNETSELLLHMKGRLDILFGQDAEALTQFLVEAGIIPKG
jgi:hypothetical protein